MNKDTPDKKWNSNEIESSVIHIKRGQEHSPQINPDIQDKSNLMYPAYMRALRALNGILKSSAEWHCTERERMKENSYPGQFRRNMELYEYSSNIIAFCGGRGQGKTSVMRSFAEALRKVSSHYPQKATPKITEMDYMDYDYVYSLPTIDPSILEEKDSIMAIILSNLFYEAEYQWNNPPHTTDRSGFYPEREMDAWHDPADSLSLYNEPGKSKLMRQFKHCFEEVRELQKPSIGGTASLDDLYEIGDSLDLKSDFFNLLENFFVLLRKDPKKSFLLVQLDDTDLQFKKAYDVLEEIRKCLSLPNVIIVMATDIDQLRFLVAQHYYKDLKIAVKHQEVDGRDVRKMAAKYLDKLIPATNAVYLPTILTSQASYIHVSDEPDMPQPLQKYFYEKIYQKTGLVFIEHRDYLHSIIPRTLRGLQHLFRLLDTMPLPEPAPILVSSSYDDTLDESTWKEYCEKRLRRVDRMKKNLLQFEDYFFSDWCSSRLTKRYWDFLREIRQDAIPSRVVAYIASHFQDVLDEENSSRNTHITHLRNNQTNGNNLAETQTKQSDKLSPENLTYQTLNNIIADPEQLGASQDDYALGFALHTYLSIQFNKRALDIQMESLQKQILRLQTDNREIFNRQYPDTPRTPDEALFFFDYNPIQEMLAPQVFDSESIQGRGIGKNDAGRFCFEIETSHVFDTPYKPKSFPNEKHLRRTFKEVIHKITGIQCDLNANPFLRTSSSDEETYVDLLHFFYNALNPFAYRNHEREGDGIKTEDQRVALNMQDCALYVCCNWDVQDQIIKSLQNPENVMVYKINGKDVFDYISKFNPKANYLNTKNGAKEFMENCTAYVSAFFSHIFNYLYEKGAPHLPNTENGEGISSGDFIAEGIYCPCKTSKGRSRKSEPEPFFYTGVIAMKSPPSKEWGAFALELYQTPETEGET